MKLRRSLLVVALFLNFGTFLTAQTQRVAVQQGPEGYTLMVDGQPFMVNGVNWDYVPIGSTVTDPGIWRESDDVIRAALDSEMALLKNMGANAIRTYNLPAKWVKYIYEKHGIYTMLNITFGAYGLTINGSWVPQTNYADRATREILMKEATDMANTYKDVPGLLLYMIGNENNYHLTWTTAETEDIPIDGSDDPNKIAAARALYKAFNDATKLVKAIDGDRPVAICNGDLLYLDLVAQECTDVDIYGTNMYRGFSFGDAFQRVRNEANMPILFSEFGSDAFNARDLQEDQIMQADYDIKNWQEIYENAAGLGKANNSLGGFTFQFSDGWWKYKQTEDFDVHNTVATWHSGGYYDYAESGDNNMNEEWFGICAKGPTNERGLYKLYPRAAYYALQEFHSINPYAPGQTVENISAAVANINLVAAELKARGDQASLELQNTNKIRLSRLSAQLTTFNTGGSLIETPKEPIPGRNMFPNQLGFDHMQSFFVGVQANPAANLRADVQFNILGNVAQNPINEIFYENRGRPIEVNTPNGIQTLNDVNRFAVYSTDIDWNTEYFDMTAFYRTGHYHWGYEGDFFGLYPEANYGPNIDIYNGTAPLGAEFEGKKELKGLKVAMGPELWWGANPAVLVKYTKTVGKVGLTGIFHEDLTQREASESSFAIPVPRTRRATLHAKTDIGPFGVEVGGIWGGDPLEGRVFQTTREIEGTEVALQDEIRASDTWGGKVKLTYSGGPINWYAQGSAMSLVANGGADLTQTFTGWRLKDSGSGNMYNFLTGFTYLLGDLQIAPNFLWQRPIEGPVPADVGGAGRPRNILNDPFVVREGNRETVAGEILFTFDPTPATWMYAWDNDRAEDAPLAVSAGFVYRHLPTVMDAAIGILPDGRTFFPFPGSAPAEDLWEAHARIVSKLSDKLGWVANVYTGTAQARGSDPRKINRSGLDLRLIYGKTKAVLGAKLNDWGPFDYHRDFNLTYPEQFQLDLSTTLGKPKWFDLPNTQIGIMGIFRTLNEFSPRYCPTRTLEAGEFVCDPTAIGFDNGQEWEIRTYLHVNIFQ